MNRFGIDRKYLVIIGMAAATIFAFVLINNLSDDPKPAENAPNVKNLTEEITQLESNIIELELLAEEQTREEGGLRQLLEEKYDEINILENKIAELEAEGIVDDETIEELKRQLASAKGKVAQELVDQLKLQYSLIYEENHQAVLKIDSLAKINGKRADTIQAYRNKLETCSGRGDLTEADLPKPTEAMMELMGKKVSFQALKKGKSIGVEKTRFGTGLNSDGSPIADGVKLCFDVKGNELVDPDQISFFARITSEDQPDGWYNSESGSGRTQVGDGGEVRYSSSLEAEYSGNSMDLCMTYNSPIPEQEFRQGRYFLEIFWKEPKKGKVSKFHEQYFTISGSSY
ncbi:hypothetical protein [Pontibacter sp. G13]|uniref:hypothetical protein n=1 Tax=Pontibacter sp. G13 TaxID=3074898 RepID=UPI00288A9110|nr:hypothetical protein [Pontibacter sp. G13]WNJ20397.1 hypothetical protein RJD25_07940 [Pontibacter sp. G13]